MKIKIATDGTPGGCHIIDADTGESVKGVRAVTFRQSWTPFVLGEIELAFFAMKVAPVEVEGELRAIEVETIGGGWRRFEFPPGAREVTAGKTEHAKA